MLEAASLCAGVLAGVPEVVLAELAAGMERYIIAPGARAGRPLPPQPQQHALLHGMVRGATALTWRRLHAMLRR